MTLLTTEVHRGAEKDVVVFAADRLIARGNKCDSERRKIFRLPSVNAGIGYFGLAEVPMRTGSYQPMSEWIQDFFYRISSDHSLEQIAVDLTEQLNTAIPFDLQKKEVSGFHLAGLACDSRAELWYVRNVDDQGRITSRGYQTREEFASRDGQTLTIGGTQIYRNGDVRAHVAAWASIDESFGKLLGTPDFRSLTTLNDYEEWVQFKMESIAAFYKRFASEPIIGGQIDTFAIA